MAFHFINADLEITSNQDLEPIRKAFEQHGDRFFDLFCGETTPGCYIASFEIHPDGEYSEDGNTHHQLTAQEKIHAFCDSIFELQGIPRDLWNNAIIRVIDLGYQSDNHCQPFHDSLSVDTLQRMASLNIALATTIYPKTIQQD